MPYELVGIDHLKWSLDQRNCFGAELLKVWMLEREDFAQLTLKSKYHMLAASALRVFAMSGCVANAVFLAPYTESAGCRDELD